ncbi:MAG: hypothetical protein HFH61_07080 [Lachnospiraceae bacterium]|nr:hypothetical protein [Lachnospiraceae bacterium]
MELTVIVMNINPGKPHTLLDNCRILKEYSLFIDVVRKNEQKEDGMKDAIKESPARNSCRILKKKKKRGAKYVDC